MPRDSRVPNFSVTDKHRQVVEIIQAAMECGGESAGSFEERQREAQVFVNEALWVAEDMEIQARVTDAPEIEVQGVLYRRLQQNSSSTLHGLHGTHVVEEKLYRQVGVRNGPTLKPIEIRCGAVTRSMLPDLGRVAGMLHGYMSSRETERVLREMDLLPPSRAFLDGHLRKMSDVGRDRRSS